MAASNNFQFIKGEDVQIDWTVRVAASPTAAVVDITDWSFSLKVKRKEGDPEPTLITPTFTVTDAPNGAVSAVFAAGRTAEMEGDYHYSFWRTNAGAQACLSRGTVSFMRTVEQ